MASYVQNVQRTSGPADGLIATLKIQAETLTTKRYRNAERHMENQQHHRRDDAYLNDNKKSYRAQPEEVRLVIRSITNPQATELSTWRASHYAEPNLELILAPRWRLGCGPASRNAPITRSPNRETRVRYLYGSQAGDFDVIARRGRGKFHKGIELLAHIAFVLKQAVARQWQSSAARPGSARRRCTTCGRSMPAHCHQR